MYIYLNFENNTLIRGDILCIYQIDGICSYDIISNSKLCTSSDCAYYSKLPES